jgi:hypothetical protein
MLPNQPMSPNMPPGGPGPGVPVGPGPEVGPEGGNPDAIKQQLIQLLKQARKVAEANGIDFNAVVSEIAGNKVRSDAPLPRPPKAEY